ncbi:hypothetical protein [Streptomyces sp. NPDC095602]|uniref:hypothetical protein n=1 Tax=Streptomyces sp. NPDC095602 TaxID=3155819 RepID=UPI00331CFEB0
MRTATRFDRRMYAIMNQREAAPLFATAGRRRALVAAHVVLTAGAAAAWLALVVGDARWALFAMLGLLLPWVVATGAINGATRGLLELRARMLDERQRAERDRVRAIAHRITTALLLAGTAGFGALLWATEVRADGRTLFAALFAALVTHWLTPLWVAGLRADDDVRGDADDLA